MFMQSSEDENEEESEGQKKAVDHIKGLVNKPAVSLEDEDDSEESKRRCSCNNRQGIRGFFDNCESLLSFFSNRGIHYLTPP